MNRKNLTLVGMVFFLMLVSVRIYAEESRKVVIFPFKVYSRENALLIEESITNHILEKLGQTQTVEIVGPKDTKALIGTKEMDDTLMRTVGSQVGGDFVISGSITELGFVISADLRVLDVRRGVFSNFYTQGKGLDGLENMASQITTELLLKMGAQKRIARIEFRGNKRIENSAINQIIKSAPGGIYSEATIAQDIKAIYKMGYFTDVSVETEDVAEGKVLIFNLQEKGIVTSVQIRGNKAINRDDIEAVISTKARQILNPDKVKADVLKIKELYDSKGYYNAQIEDTIEKEGEKDVRVIFTISEGGRLYIRGISFTGNEAFTDKELIKLMDTQVKGLFSFITDSGILKKETLRQDVEKINAFYLNQGYIYAQVGEPEITHDQRGIYIKIPITEGKQFKVGKVDITGDPLKTEKKEIFAKLAINKKSYYSREAVMQDMDYLQQLCNDEGFAYAEIIPQTTPNEKELTVDVIYQVNKGRQVYFNRINITGNTKTRDKVIRRLLKVVEGDLYNKTKLRDSYMAINRLRYFEEVDFQTEKGPEESLMDLNIRVKEKPTGVFSIGAGYSAQDNAIFMAQVAQQNLFGRGQSLSLRANISSTTTNYELSFIEPWLFDIPLWTRIDLWKTYRIYDTYNLDSNGGGLTFGYPLWEYVTGYVGYRFSVDDVRDVSENASSYIKKQAGTTTTSSLTFTLTRDTTDDYIFPTKGSKNSFSLEYTGGILQGDASFIKYTASSSWFFPMPLDTVIGVRGRAGYLQEMEGKEAPVYERFYLGGINSLRGLRYVGPVDPATGDVIGGLTMLNFNAEFLFPLIKNAGMKGLIFFDTGNAWESGYHLDDMRKTAGAGIRWYSPIGPLRLEWGYVLDAKGEEPKSRWEFSIGTFM